MSIVLFILILFIMNTIIFLIMRNKKDKNYVYIKAFCVYNSRVYWLKQETLYSSDYSNQEIDVISGGPVDQFSDLMPVEAIAIIEHLQERQ